MSERPRRLAVLTTGRQDYGLLRSTILALADRSDFETLVWAGGMHSSLRFGRPRALLDADGVRVTRELDYLSEPPNSVNDLAAVVRMVGDAIEADAPEAILLVGDRSETAAAGLVATLLGVPIAHLHGGEETEGAVDNAFRHALTKMSHLHLVSHPLHAKRVIQMGEPPESVVVVGAPGLDNLYRDDLPGRPELEAAVGVELRSPVVLVTMHPTTLGGPDPCAETRAVADALESVGGTCVITMPNSDSGGAEIAAFWRGWAVGRPGVALVEALGERRYWGMLKVVDAVVGNSSSGIIEAPSAGVPVVNVGDRQKGRLRQGRVADVPPEAVRVADALREALHASPTQAFHSKAGDDDGYPSGPAAPRIVDALASWQIPRPPRKHFEELAIATPRNPRSDR